MAPRGEPTIVWLPELVWRRLRSSAAAVLMANAHSNVRALVTLARCRRPGVHMEACLAYALDVCG